MADNVPITAGSGTPIAADDIGSVWYQRVKLSLGADGVAKDFQPATAVAVVSASTDVAAVATACTLFGWSFGESAATAATAELYLRDGSGGTILAHITLNPDESIRENAPACGIKCATGVYVDMISGTADGSVWVVT